MQVPVEWLREYVEFNEPLEEIAEKLTQAGLEVGEIADERFGYENSFVGKVTKVETHPERSEFRVLTVEGGGMSKTVISNLRDFSVGELLPIACEGYVFPDGTKLECRKFGSVLSDGKILAESEIEYSDNSEVILPLPADAKAGVPVPDAIGITSKVFKFDLTSNRSDCLCVTGIARELSAILGRPLLKNVFDFQLPEAELDIEFSVDIKAPKMCPRYTGRVIRDVKVTASPMWMRRRLTASGMRPINSIVDITNYVMLETGQPQHAFDLDTLKDRAIIVRKAKKNEKIKTLDDGERELTPEMLVIADAERAVAVAGVMGGADTEISGATVNMLLESAHFDPRTIRRSATGLGMRTEASLRFEKGVNPVDTKSASDYASYLIHKLGIGKPLSGLIDANPAPHKTKTIKLNPANIRDLAVPGISDEDIASILKSLGFGVEKPAKGKTLSVSVPGHRFDISIWQDLAEEVARIYGYNRIPSELPSVRLHRAGVSENQLKSSKIRRNLVAAGLSEIVNFSFTNETEMGKLWKENRPEAVRIRNPLTDDHTHLRPSLAPCMLTTIARSRANSPDTAVLFFELGKIFRNQAAPEEVESLALGLCGNSLTTPARSQYGVDFPLFYVMKGIVERFVALSLNVTPEFRTAKASYLHPYRAAEVVVEGEVAGIIGEVHPEVLSRFDIRDNVAIAELNPAIIKKHIGKTPKYSRISRRPALVRDLSFVVDDDVNAADVAASISKHGSELLKAVKVFDVFSGGNIESGRKSVTFTLEFRAADRTLTDEEVKPVIDRVIAGVRDETGGVLRDS